MNENLKFIKISKYFEKHIDESGKLTEHEKNIRFGLANAYFDLYHRSFTNHKVLEINKNIESFNLDEIKSKSEYDNIQKDINEIINFGDEIEYF